MFPLPFSLPLLSPVFPLPVVRKEITMKEAVPCWYGLKWHHAMCSSTTFRVTKFKLLPLSLPFRSPVFLFPLLPPLSSPLFLFPSILNLQIVKLSLLKSNSLAKSYLFCHQYCFRCSCFRYPFRFRLQCFHFLLIIVMSWITSSKWVIVDRDSENNFSLIPFSFPLVSPVFMFPLSTPFLPPLLPFPSTNQITTFIHCSSQIGRAHVWTPVTSAHLVCRLLLEKKKKKKYNTKLTDYIIIYNTHFLSQASQM